MRRVRLLLGLSALPALATLILGGAYLRGALDHRDAVLASADQVAAVMLRDLFDVLAREIRVGSSSYLDAGLLGDDSRASRLDRMGRVADSLGTCGCPGGLPVAAFGLADATTGEGRPEGSDEWNWTRMVETGPSRLFSALTETADEPRLTILRAFQAADTLPTYVAWIDVDLSRFGPTVLDPALDRILAAYLGHLEDPPGASVGLRVTHPAGAVVFERGPAPEATPVAAEIDLFTEELATAQAVATPGMPFTLAMGSPVIAALIPGGLPASPWPLVLVTTLGALAVTGMGAVFLLQLRRVTAMREQFVSSVSHELRTPLAKILSYGETLQLDRPTPRARERAARTIVREARKLTHLVENTLDFARMERAAPTLTPESVDLAVFLPRVVGETLDLFAASPEIEVEVVGTPTLWADRTALARIVRNLLENAVRHTPSGARIEVRAAPEGQTLRIDVDDAGPGIPAAERTRVWEAFYHNPRQPGVTGSGLGLAIVRQLVELHGGAVTIGESSLGGARVSVLLPRSHSEPGAH